MAVTAHSRRNPLGHQDFVDFPAFMQEAGGDAADFGKAFTLVKLDRGGVFSTGGKLQLNDTRSKRKLGESGHHCGGDAVSPAGGANINHNHGSAMGHFAGLLAHQPHDSNRLTVPKSNEHRIGSQPVRPFLQ